MPLTPVLIARLAGGLIPHDLEECICLRVAVSVFTGSKSFIAGPVKNGRQGISKYILKTTPILKTERQGFLQKVTAIRKAWPFTH